MELTAGVFDELGWKLLEHLMCVKPIYLPGVGLAPWRGRHSLRGRFGVGVACEGALKEFVEEAWRQQKIDQPNPTESCTSTLKRVL